MKRRGGAEGAGKRRCGAALPPFAGGSGTSREIRPRGRAPLREGIGDGFVPRSHPRPCVKCGDGPAAVVIRIGDAFCR